MHPPTTHHDWNYSRILHLLLLGFHSIDILVPSPIHYPRRDLLNISSWDPINSLFAQVRSSISDNLISEATKCVPSRWLASNGREDEAWSVIALFDAEGADRQREKIQESIQREREHRETLRKEQAILSRTGNVNALSGCLGKINGNVHAAAVKETFHEDVRSRTVFGMVVSGTFYALYSSGTHGFG
jgi:hypothetical protein